MVRIHQKKGNVAHKKRSKSKVRRTQSLKAKRDICVSDDNTIVEFSYNSGPQHIIVRFLNGENYVVNIDSLPHKFRSRSTQWEHMQLWHDRTRLLIGVNSKILELPAKIIRERGDNLDKTKVK